MEELKEVVRKIRAGVSVEGFTLEGNVLKNGDKTYQVQGEARLRISEVTGYVAKPVEVVEPTSEAKDEAPVAQEKAPRKVREKLPKILDKVCGKCGKEFTVSKFNPYFEDCPTCRTRDRRTGGVDRKFVCLKCGKDFWITKYQPYIENPEMCPNCHRNEGIRRRAKNRELRKG